MPLDYVEFGFEEEETSFPLDVERNRAALIETYRTVYRDSLYEEAFTYDEVDRELERYRANRNYEGVLAVDGADVIGFGFGFQLVPAMNDTEWRTEHDFVVTGSEDDHLGSYFEGDTYYFAELGVLPEMRRNDIGYELKRRELERVKDLDYVDRGLMRTRKDNRGKIRGIDEPLGFERLPWETEVDERRKSGEVETDIRIWMETDLS